MDLSEDDLSDDEESNGPPTLHDEQADGVGGRSAFSAAAPEDDLDEEDGVGDKGSPHEKEAVEGLCQDFEHLNASGSSEPRHVYEDRLEAAPAMAVQPPPAVTTVPNFSQGNASSAIPSQGQTLEAPTGELTDGDVESDSSSESEIPPPEPTVPNFSQGNSSNAIPSQGQTLEASTGELTDGDIESDSSSGSKNSSINDQHHQFNFDLSHANPHQLDRPIIGGGKIRTTTTGKPNSYNNQDDVDDDASNAAGTNADADEADASLGGVAVGIDGEDAHTNAGSDGADANAEALIASSNRPSDAFNERLAAQNRRGDAAILRSGHQNAPNHAHRLRRAVQKHLRPPSVPEDQFTEDDDLVMLGVQ